MKSLTVAVIYGGKSVEHEVSVHSAADVCNILSEKYKVLPVFIDKKGGWFLQEKCGFSAPSDRQITPVLGCKTPFKFLTGEDLAADVLFPVLHGTNGEDGAVQGLFELMELPYAGCGVLTSAMGMDKIVSKRLAARAGAPALPFVSVEKGEDWLSKTEDIKKLGLPVFVKPVNLGSSVGITKVKDLQYLSSAVDFAFQFDKVIMIEQGVDNAREIFCAVCGGDDARVSPCGELIPSGHEFFDYQAKYVDPGGCIVKVPAAVEEKTEKEMREYSLRVFKELRGFGLARVDFLLGSDGKFFFSEINTLPGLSNASLFPQLWRAAGRDYADVLKEIIDAAVSRRAAVKVLQTDKE